MENNLKAALEEESSHFTQNYLWLENNMSKEFFDEVGRDWILLIVHSLMGFKVEEYFSAIHLKHAAIVLCLDKEQADSDILKDYPLYGIKNYTTYLSLNPLPFVIPATRLKIAVIHFTEYFKPSSTEHDLETTSYLSTYLKNKYPNLTQEECETLVLEMDPLFLKVLSVERRSRALELFYRATTRDHCQYDLKLEKEWKEKAIASLHLMLAWKNVPKHRFLFRLARLVHRHGLVIKKVNATYIPQKEFQSIFMLSLALQGANETAAWESCDLEDFLQELTTLKYFGSLDLIDQLLVEPRHITGNQGNFLRVMMNFIHQVLVHVNPHEYSLENIEQDLTYHSKLAHSLCQAFEAKFHPEHSSLSEYENIKKEFLNNVYRLDTGHEFYDKRRKNVLIQGINFIEHILKTNYYKNNITSFAFRLDPHYLDHVPFNHAAVFPELPFGIFFFKGMHFIGFHIRFKDLARGGLRTVFPDKRERLLIERNTLFTECYNLAYTQHKKNKDIPEGGAKGVILLKPYERLEEEAQIFTLELQDAGFSREEILQTIQDFKNAQKKEYLYQTQRSYVKNLLSLINTDPTGKLRSAKVVDYWKKPEYIYLGPDENMHNSMIEWIAQESQKEDYQIGGAFISGKLKAGINHKEFGVTSLGVNVYMEEVLKYLGIDPRNEPFTVKMTGGPDGDVAGNQIHNLFRFYPHTAKLIALTDASGTIFDPLGLDLSICNDLFLNGFAINQYPPEKLTKGGFLLDRLCKKELSQLQIQTGCYRNIDGKLTKHWLSGSEMNTLYRSNVHQAKTTMFLPCGGRPFTLQESNLDEFLDEKGEPTARAIVEGANLYFSNEARKELEKKGVLIIKDSSANKGGVISSSFEILMGLILIDEEFIELKAFLVEEALTRVKRFCHDEAHLLLSTFKQTHISLTELSSKISEKINSFTDQVLSYLETISLSCDPEDPLIACFLHDIPLFIREKYQDRLIEKVPKAHQKAIIAARIASHLVYTKGLDWSPSLVDILPLVTKSFKG